MAFNLSELKTSMSELGRSLALPERSSEFAKNFINDKLFNELKESKTKYSINRTRILGSAGKHTGIWAKLDFDCVVFVNKVPLPHDIRELDRVQQDILKDWEIILGGEADHEGRRVVISHEGVEIDLLIGFNGAGSQGDISEAQKRSLLSQVKRQTIGDRIKLSKAYSPSLSEFSAEFMSRQSSVTHELVRIVKLWVTFSGLIDRRVAGKGLIIEMICVEAMKKVVDKHNIFEGFKTVLKLIENFESLAINAEDANFLDQTERSQVLQKPYIIDPSNPYNNLLKGQSVHFFLRTLKGMAQETAGKLEKPNFSQNTWENLMMSLYIRGSAERCGYSRVRYLHICETTNVHMPQVTKCSDSLKDISDKLMRFICCVASFIPKEQEKAQAGIYTNFFLDALTHISANGLKRSCGTEQNVNFEMVFPLGSWGIKLGAIID